MWYGHIVIKLNDGDPIKLNTYLNSLPLGPDLSMTKKSSALDLSADPIHYRVDIDEPNTHRFRVTLTIARPAAQQRLSLPVWIPGSYLVREFAKNLSSLQARQGRSSRVTARQLDKCTWQIDCSPAKPLVVSYEVYARDNSVRTAWLDADRGFFNGTSLCLRVEGQEQAAHALEVPLPNAAANWSVATGLKPDKIDKRGFGTYRASSYDELVDCPVEMGTFWSGSFTACGVPHRFVVAGALPGFDGTRLLADTQKICEAEIRFWHNGNPPPFASYLFMLNAVDDGYGGLEHRNSTALICNRKDLPRAGEPKISEGYTTLRGLISHEYFHTWNVKSTSWSMRCGAPRRTTMSRSSSCRAQAVRSVAASTFQVASTSGTTRSPPAASGTPARTW